uniref:FAD-dependent thymidylate synthase n=1 Tax=Prevotella sp. GTC17259 TaxID=3236795 RepID=A0AB33JAX8_9BACT
MNILSPTYEIWNQEAGLDGLYKQIERCGRVCYKSEGNRTESSAKPFVERMIKSDHTAMLEHGTVYMTMNSKQAEKYILNKFSKCVCENKQAFVTTNLRVLAENKWMDDLTYMTEPSAKHEKRVTVHFTTQISITREFNRHRANSMAEQSTRYCNYTKDKFGREITVNTPHWIGQLLPDNTDTVVETTDFKQLCSQIASGEASEKWTLLDNWLFANLACEFAYMNLIRLGCKPQDARAILPLDTNTELIHTAFVSDWKHFFNLRAIGTTGVPHPDAQKLAKPLYEEFTKLGLI